MTPNLTHTKEQIEAHKDGLTVEHLDALMASFSGTTYAQAAASLGMPLGTFKSRLHRARIALDELIKEGR